jgi:transposase-like protein
MFGISYRAAWFMMHRLRCAIGESSLKDKLLGVIEADETYIGGKAHGKRGRGAANKSIVFSLVERNGEVRSQKVQNVTGKNLKEIIKRNVTQESTIMTDDFGAYKGLEKDFAVHGVVKHLEKEYVNGDIYTNTAEGFFSLLKRGINGTFHHVSEQHLPLYLNEFDFKYNNRKICDFERTKKAISMVSGKRLIYAK